MTVDLKKIKLDSKKVNPVRKGGALDSTPLEILISQGGLSNGVNFFRFKKFGQKYLLTNDIGHYIFLTPAQFRDFLSGILNYKSAIYQELEEKGFIKDNFNSDQAISRYRHRDSNLFYGTTLHIIVVTLGCNFRCIYCQASSRPVEEKGYDMDLNTAKRVVDFIFKSPSPFITIEFQGGEPLVNWPVVKFIVEYARKKNETEGKQLTISLVSNFSLMSEEKLKFLIKNKVSLCTSLDGPEKLHNKNRPWPEGKSYQITTLWIEKIKKLEKEREKKGEKMYHLSALLTVSKNSLPFPKEIVDEYLKWGFDGMHLRPLSYLGLAKNFKEKVGYSIEEFMKFWKRAVDYIIRINLNGKLFLERGTGIMLQKILTETDSGYTDLRSPCGAVIGQMVYNYNGKIYTCDEGRMYPDDTFLLGDIKKGNYENLLSCNKTKAMITASTLDNSPCDYCVYKPYCGVCPVLNYSIYGNLFPQLPNTDWCKRQREMFDYLFEKLQNKKIKKIFEEWV